MRWNLNIMIKKDPYHLKPLSFFIFFSLGHIQQKVGKSEEFLVWVSLIFWVNSKKATAGGGDAYQHPPVFIRGLTQLWKWQCYECCSLKWGRLKSERKNVQNSLNLGKLQKKVFLVARPPRWGDGKGLVTRKK